jgi:hypothetical protein
MLIPEMSGQESRDLLARLWLGNVVPSVTLDATGYSFFPAGFSA